jgi:hypothetical protein
MLSIQSQRMLDTLIFKGQKTIDDLDSEEMIIIELYIISITLQRIPPFEYFIIMTLTIPRILS